MEYANELEEDLDDCQRDLESAITEIQRLVRKSDVLLHSLNVSNKKVESQKQVDYRWRTTFGRLLKVVVDDGDPCSWSDLEAHLEARLRSVGETEEISSISEVSDPVVDLLKFPQADLSQEALQALTAYVTGQPQETLQPAHTTSLPTGSSWFSSPLDEAKPAVKNSPASESWPALNVSTLGEIHKHVNEILFLRKRIGVLESQNAKLLISFKRLNNECVPLRQFDQLKAQVNQQESEFQLRLAHKALKMELTEYDNWRQKLEEFLAREGGETDAFMQERYNLLLEALNFERGRLRKLDDLYARQTLRTPPALPIAPADMEPPPPPDNQLVDDLKLEIQVVRSQCSLYYQSLASVSRLYDRLRSTTGETQNVDYDILVETNIRLQEDIQALRSDIQENDAQLFGELSLGVCGPKYEPHSLEAASPAPLKEAEDQEETQKLRQFLEVSLQASQARLAEKEARILALEDLIQSQQPVEADIEVSHLKVQLPRETLDEGAQCDWGLKEEPQADSQLQAAYAALSLKYERDKNQWITEKQAAQEALQKATRMIEDQKAHDQLMVDQEKKNELVQASADEKAQEFQEKERHYLSQIRIQEENFGQLLAEVDSWKQIKAQKEQVSKEVQTSRETYGCLLDQQKFQGLLAFLRDSLDQNGIGLREILLAAQAVENGGLAPARIADIVLELPIFGMVYDFRGILLRSMAAFEGEGCVVDFLGWLTFVSEKVKEFEGEDRNHTSGYQAFAGLLSKFSLQTCLRVLSQDGQIEAAHLKLVLPVLLFSGFSTLSPDDQSLILKYLSAHTNVPTLAAHFFPESSGDFRESPRVHPDWKESLRRAYRENLLFDFQNQTLLIRNLNKLVFKHSKRKMSAQEFKNHLRTKFDIEVEITGSPAAIDANWVALQVFPAFVGDENPERRFFFELDFHEFYDVRVDLPGVGLEKHASHWIEKVLFYLKMKFVSTLLRQSGTPCLLHYAGFFCSSKHRASNPTQQACLTLKRLAKLFNSLNIFVTPKDLQVLMDSFAETGGSFRDLLPVSVLVEAIGRVPCAELAFRFRLWTGPPFQKLLSLKKAFQKRGVSLIRFLVDLADMRTPHLSSSAVDLPVLKKELQHRLKVNLTATDMNEIFGLSPQEEYEMEWSTKGRQAQRSLEFLVDRLVLLEANHEKWLLVQNAFRTLDNESIGRRMVAKLLEERSKKEVVFNINAMGDQIQEPQPGIAVSCQTETHHLLSAQELETGIPLSRMTKVWKRKFLDSKAYRDQLLAMEEEMEGLKRQIEVDLRAELLRESRKSARLAEELSQLGDNDRSSTPPAALSKIYQLEDRVLERDTQILEMTYKLQVQQPRFDRLLLANKEAGIFPPQSLPNFEAEKLREQLTTLQNDYTRKEADYKHRIAGFIKEREADKLALRECEKLIHEYDTQMKSMKDHCGESKRWDSERLELLRTVELLDKENKDLRKDLQTLDDDDFWNELNLLRQRTEDSKKVLSMCYHFFVSEEEYTEAQLNVLLQELSKFA